MLSHTHRCWLFVLFDFVFDFKANQFGYFSYFWWFCCCCENWWCFSGCDWSDVWYYMDGGEPWKDESKRFHPKNGLSLGQSLWTPPGCCPWHKHIHPKRCTRSRHSDCAHAYRPTQPFVTPSDAFLYFPMNRLIMRCDVRSTQPIFETVFMDDCEPCVIQKWNKCHASNTSFRLARKSANRFQILNYCEFVNQVEWNRTEANKWKRKRDNFFCGKFQWKKINFKLKNGCWLYDGSPIQWAVCWGYSRPVCWWTSC